MISIKLKLYDPNFTYLLTIVVDNFNNQIFNSKSCDTNIYNGEYDHLKPNAKQKRNDIPLLRMDKYLLLNILNELRISKNYRNAFINKHKNFIKDHCCKLKIVITESKVEYFNYRWCERLNQLCEERQELDYTMSWLSTLGGAFSALGDHFVNCAEIAGKISAHQFKLALRIGDPLTVARCKLFLSLSLIQRSHFRLAKFLVKEQFKLAKMSSVPDVRLENMCKGIWEKLRYERKAYKHGKLVKKIQNTQIKIC